MIERTHTWGNQDAKLRWCTERRRTVVEFWLALANAAVTCGRPVRRAWTCYRWEGHPAAIRDRLLAQPLSRVDQTAPRPNPATAQENPMQAIVHSRYGPPDALELNDIETPVINDDAVLVQVHAAAVGKGDWLTVQGLPYVARLRYGLPRPKHPVPGFDVAGRIEAVGSNVTQLQPGDAVFGWCDGSFAEYASVPEGRLALKPANLTFEQAAAVPISGFAALQALRDTRRGPARTNGGDRRASGGVGSFAVQLAKAFGAQVTRVCSTKSVDLVRSIGADHVIDYTQQDFTRTGQRYDLILELAGNRSLAELRRALTPTGTLVLVGGSGGRWLMGTGRTLRAVLVSRFVGQRLRSFFSKPRGGNLVVLKELLETDKLTPVIDRTFPAQRDCRGDPLCRGAIHPRQNRHHRVRPEPPG